MTYYAQLIVGGIKQCCLSVYLCVIENHADTGPYSGVKCLQNPKRGSVIRQFHTKRQKVRKGRSDRNEIW